MAEELFTGTIDNIDNSNYKGTVLAYPSNLHENRIKTDYIRFSFYESTGALDAGRREGIFTVIDENDIQSKNKALNDVYQAPPSNKKEIENYPNFIYLYMPPNVSTTFKSQWEGKSINSATKNVIESTSSLEKTIQTILKTVGGADAQHAIAAGLAKIAGATGTNITGDDFFSLRSGAVTNPNTELVFQKHDLRTFQLKFKFNPETPEEAIRVRHIYNCFRRASLPKFGADIRTASVTGLTAEVIDEVDVLNVINTLNETSYITIPDLCNVEFRSNTTDNRFLPRYNLCAITDVHINFTPENRYSTYEDGAPVATELTLGFLETKLQYKQNYF